MMCNLGSNLGSLDHCSMSVRQLLGNFGTISELAGIARGRLFGSRSEPFCRRLLGNLIISAILDIDRAADTTNLSSIWARSGVDFGSSRRLRVRGGCPGDGPNYLGAAFPGEQVCGGRFGVDSASMSGPICGVDLWSRSRGDLRSMRSGEFPPPPVSGEGPWRAVVAGLRRLRGGRWRGGAAGHPEVPGDPLPHIAPAPRRGRRAREVWGSARRLAELPEGRLLALRGRLGIDPQSPRRAPERPPGVSRPNQPPDRTTVPPQPCGRPAMCCPPADGSTV